MKPVLILQHLDNDGPGYLADWLHAQGIGAELRNTQAGQAYPADMGDFSGLAILGGAMSANDPLPSLRQAERLILDAMVHGRPVIGHCLGGQLMARALGARVADAQQPEIGWQSIEVAASAEARRWFGEAGGATVFQWHHQAFDLPSGAVALASSPGCRNQAFAIGPHLAMQFHIEIDAHKAATWALEGEPGHLQHVGRCATVQSAEAIVNGIATELVGHQRLADRIYTCWASGLGR